MTEKEKQDYIEINKIMDEHDKKCDIETNKMIKKRNLIRVKHDPLNNWEVTAFTKEEIEKIKQKPMKDIINEYAEKGK